MTGDPPNSLRLSVDPQSVAAARADLRAMVRGNPIAEAAVEGFNDWEVIEAMERLWGAATSDQPAEEPGPPLNETASRLEG
ncbi:MAG: hypothetical protein JWM24_1830 [Solirubrobacterales bacterium]|nr:hypothetical protein [Solirubrobacterales bacterium]